MFLFSSLVQFHTMPLAGHSQNYALGLLGLSLGDHNVL